MKGVRIGLVVIASTVALAPALPEATEPRTGTDEARKALQRREAALRELAADSTRIVRGLEGLTKGQKNAVIALLAVSRAAGVYEARVGKKDDLSLAQLYASMRPLSPAYKAPGKFQGLLKGCFDATVSCLGARKKCLDDGKKEDQCDRDARVIEACANEVICITDAFLKLHQAVPAILGGRDPWPPQPFPY